MADPDEEQGVAELVTFRCASGSFVYAPIPHASTYGHRAELWDVDHWLKEVQIKVVFRGDSLMVRLEDLDTGELFAECPLPSDGTPLTTAIEPVVDSSRYYVLKVVDREDPHKHAFVGLGFRERGDSSDFAAALDEYRQYLRRRKEAMQMRESYEQQQRQQQQQQQQQRQQQQQQQQSDGAEDEAVASASAPSRSASPFAGSLAPLQGSIRINIDHLRPSDSPSGLLSRAVSHPLRAPETGWAIKLPPPPKPATAAAAAATTTATATATAAAAAATTALTPPQQQQEQQHQREERQQQREAWAGIEQADAEMCVKTMRRLSLSTGQGGAKVLDQVPQSQQQRQELEAARCGGSAMRQRGSMPGGSASGHSHHRSAEGGSPSGQSHRAQPPLAAFASLSAAKVAECAGPGAARGAGGGSPGQGHEAPPPRGASACLPAAQAAEENAAAGPQAGKGAGAAASGIKITAVAGGEDAWGEFVG